MTDADQPPAKRRRRRRPVEKSRRCRREGCTRQKGEGYECCDPLCYIVAERVRAAELLCRMLGQGPRSQELWLAAVELNDALTRFNLESARALGTAEKASENGV